MPRLLGKSARLSSWNISQSEGLRKWMSRRTNRFESLNMEKTVKKFLIVGRSCLYHGKHERCTKGGIYFPPPRASCKALTIPSGPKASFQVFINFPDPPGTVNPLTPGSNIRNPP